MMHKKWIFPEKNSNNDILKTILKNRGIVGKKEQDEFLSDRPKVTFDPFLLKNMDEASERILDAVYKNEKICIYGDYDADGVCGVSLLAEILGKLGADFTYYIPSRFDEGYGLNSKAIEKIGARGTNLIITVDCGSSSYDEVEYARSLSIDVIVTDHHNLNDNPVTCLLVNPKQDDCPYPEKDLSGCGVAFKLAQALERKRPDALSKADLNGVLDLAAIATIGDIVSLMGENRTIVKYGLATVNRKTRPGLLELIRTIDLDIGEIKSEEVAYLIVPHLNAAGRMFSAKSGVKLLTSKNQKEITEASKILTESNRERKELQDAAFKKAVTEFEETCKDEKFIVLYLPEAHEGITGIVAGKLKDAYGRPAIILTSTGDNMLKGTGRSVEGLNLYEALSSMKEIFIKFGGHAGACGFTLESRLLPELKWKLNRIAENVHRENPEVFIPKLEIDSELFPEQITKDFLSSLERLEPFGHDNPKPLFALRRILANSPFYMGDEKQHVRFEAKGISCILFNDAEKFKSHYEGNVEIDIAGYPRINRWNGYERIQFVVEDIQTWKEETR